ncbi:hypothetical protein ASG53_06490 [Sanguibacter sp. Leaf3]|nr:hypothetical protein ASG53_06490 [Sanguibacter sp. Leaf3]
MVPKKAAKPQFTSTMLVLEAFVVLFATLTASRLIDVPASTVWIVGGVLALVLVILSRTVAAPGGYIAGSLVQLPVLAISIVIPLMIPVAVVFIALWVVSLWLGAKIDRERAEYDAAHPDEAPNV